jgi:hypothetical protein
MSLDQYMFDAIESLSASDTPIEIFADVLRDRVSLMAGLSSADEFCLD